MQRNASELEMYFNKIALRKNNLIFFKRVNWWIKYVLEKDLKFMPILDRYQHVIPGILTESELQWSLEVKCANSREVNLLAIGKSWGRKKFIRMGPMHWWNSYKDIFFAWKYCIWNVNGFTNHCLTLCTWNELPRSF